MTAKNVILTCPSCGFSKDVPEMPAFFRFMMGHVRLFFASFLMVSAAMLGAAVGLLKRKNRTRLLFIAILSLGITWNIVGMVLQFFFMQDFPKQVGAPPEFATVFSTMRTVIMLFSALFALGFSALFGWLIKRFTSTEIRRDLVPGHSNKGTHEWCPYQLFPTVNGLLKPAERRPELAAEVAVNRPGAKTSLLYFPSGSQVGGTSLATIVEVSPLPPKPFNSEGTASIFVERVVMSIRMIFSPITFSFSLNDDPQCPELPAKNKPHVRKVFTCRSLPCYPAHPLSPFLAQCRSVEGLFRLAATTCRLVVLHGFGNSGPFLRLRSHVLMLP
jgi:hypothetical protein